MFYYRTGLCSLAFQFYFIQRGLFWDSFLAVWLHGTPEISAMVICGTAGLVLGKGFVFPGTYSRTQSFLSSAQRATKIFFSVLPITVTAGIIESFLTRYTQAPDVLRLALIMISLFFILGYYVYLPWLKKRNGTLRIPEAEKVLPENFPPFEFYTIKKVSEMILDTFRFFRKYSAVFMSTILRSVLIFTLIGITINKKYLLQDIYYTEWSLINLNHYLIADYNNWFSIALPVLFVYISVQVMYLFSAEMAEQHKTARLSFSDWTRQHFRPIILNSCIQAAFYLFLSFYKFELYTYLFIIPMQFIASFSVFFPYAQIGTAKRFNSFTTTFKSGLMHLFAIHTVFILLSLALFMLISSSIFWIIYQAVTMNLTNEVADSDSIFLLFFLVAVTTIITISIFFFCIYQGVFYFSQKERHSAEGLIQQLDKLGKSTKKHVL
ncbi:MAG: stage II sporulation protein M [Chitinophagales bacterium]